MGCSRNKTVEFLLEMLYVSFEPFAFPRHLVGALAYIMPREMRLATLIMLLNSSSLQVLKWNFA